MQDESERPLEGGWQTDVRRAGDIVLRSPKPQSRTVIALLRHLDSVGFDAAPRPVGSGFAPDGREQLGYIEGESPHPYAWSDNAAWELGGVLSRLHVATETFVAPREPVWRPWFARSLPGARPVIGHGDLGAWNILARDGVPVALIDWDNAGPVDALWELAQLVWLNAQLHDDDVAATAGLGSPVERARQAALILDGYGLAAQSGPDSPSVWWSSPSGARGKKQSTSPSGRKPSAPPATVSRFSGELHGGLGRPLGFSITANSFSPRSTPDRDCLAQPPSRLPSPRLRPSRDSRPR